MVFEHYGHNCVYTVKEIEEKYEITENEKETNGVHIWKLIRSKDEDLYDGNILEQVQGMCGSKPLV